MTAEQFLVRYNRERSLDCALSSAIKAASQHNKLYVVADAPRAEIRTFWREQLSALREAYEQQRTVAEYETDILNLKTSLNKKFHGLIDCRVSHAQKSIGVFLKHLWCMGLAATPPQCPVDAIILKAAGAVYPATNWGYINTIEVHRAKVAVLMAAKNLTDPQLSLAEWELAAFN